MNKTILVALCLFSRAILFAQVSAPSIETSFQNYLRATSGRINPGGVLPVFLNKEDTRGNRYLFDKWVEGSVLGTDGVTYKFTIAALNYDKIVERLYILIEPGSVIELSTGDIAGFSLKNNDTTFLFERLKNSTDLHFYQPVYKAEKGYSLYKLLATNFKKADYQTNGIVSSGNKYDEYVDEQQYFVLTPKQEMVKIDLRKKTIERALAPETAKVEAFFAEHKKEKLNEDFVKNLLQSLNSQ